MGCKSAGLEPRVFVISGHWRSLTGEPQLQRATATTATLQLLQLFLYLKVLKTHPALNNLERFIY